MRRYSWLVPSVYILFLMLPIYWLLNMSFKTTNEILGEFSLWPRNFTVENYMVIFTDPTWYNVYFNSLTYVGINTVMSVSVTTSRGKKVDPEPPTTAAYRPGGVFSR